MRDLMIDIETLGKRPGSIIASVGAVEFDAMTGEIGREFYVIIDVESAERAGLTMDTSTVIWWLKQNPEAITTTFATGEHINKALLDLGWFVLNAEPLRVWAHSPSFDLVQLEEAYRSTDLKCPWSYFQARDTRTLYDLADIKPVRTGTHHNALDDAKSQAHAVISAYSILQPAKMEA